MLTRQGCDDGCNEGSGVSRRTASHGARSGRVLRHRIKRAPVGQGGSQLPGRHGWDYNSLGPQKRAKLRWPDGHEQVLVDVDADQHLVVNEK